MRAEFDSLLPAVYFGRFGFAVWSLTPQTNTLQLHSGQTLSRGDPGLGPDAYSQAKALLFYRPSRSEVGDIGQHAHIWR